MISHINSILQNQWQCFRLALQFLTCIPVGKTAIASPRQWACTVLWYPLAGLLIGLFLLLLLLGIQIAASSLLPSLLISALVLTLWVALTGALHLDGLADSVDAWVGGQGDRQRTLEIMKDSRSGSMAVVALVIVLMLKLAALAALIDMGWQTLLPVTAPAAIPVVPVVALITFILVPALARATLLAAFLFVPYVRLQGLGAGMAENLPKHPSRILLAISAFLPVLMLPWEVWIPFALTWLAVFTGWRKACITRLGGFTGDCAGALVEILETAFLITLAITLTITMTESPISC